MLSLSLSLYDFTSPYYGEDFRTNPLHSGQARPGLASAEEIFILLYFHLSIDRYVHMYVCM